MVPDALRSIPFGLPTALDDVRVIELGGRATEWCGKLLADLGADVLKVEPPGGDATRRIGPFVDDHPDPNGSLHFWHYNTSKRGLTLNLGCADGRDLFRRLVETADVVLEDFRPGHLSSLGLGYEDLATIRPAIILTSITPFGQHGPWRDLLASDLIHLALGGPMGVTGYDDPDAPPIGGKGGQAYHIGGNWAFIGTLAALIERDVSGRGQQVDCSIHEACAVCTEVAVPHWIATHKLVRRQTGRHAAVLPTPQWQYRCADGQYLCMIMPNMKYSQFRAVVEWLDAAGMAEDLTDPKYESWQVRRDDQPHIFEVIGRFVAAHNADQLYHGAQQRDLAWGPVRAPEENLRDPHFWDRGFFVAVDHPGRDKPLVYPGAPYHGDDLGWRIARAAPSLGEHNEEIYRGELGLPAGDLVALAESGVI
ncbi:MAG TPA: CoA transferase [Dehalococcoidia bacterium]|nr:CoA transferase [Dehalococcoidia bacterium]